MGNRKLNTIKIKSEYTDIKLIHKKVGWHRKEKKLRLINSYVRKLDCAGPKVNRQAKYMGLVCERISYND